MVPLFSGHQNLWVRKDFRYYLNQPIYCGFTWPTCLPLESLAWRTDVPSEGYDDAEEIPVPKAPPASQRSKREVPPEEENRMRVSQTGEWD